MNRKEAQPEARPTSRIAKARFFAVVLGEEFRAPFAFHDAATGELLEGPSCGDERLPQLTLPPSEVLQVAAADEVRVAALPDCHYQVVLPLHEGDRPILIAVGQLTGFARTPAERSQEQANYQKWLQSVRDRLRAATLGSTRRPEAGKEREAAAAWEAVMALEQVLRRVRIHKEAARNQKHILQAAAAVLRAEAVIWVPQQAQAEVVVGGECGLSAWDCRQLANLLAASPGWEKPGFLLCDQPQETPWGARFPQVRNLIGLAVPDPGAPGWVILLNKKGASTAPEPSRQAAVAAAARVLPPLGNSDAVLLTPFVALLGLHARSARRYHEVKDLLVGLTRSLTASIDAKDAYTYGHSERVGRIAVELGHELGLSEGEVSDVYLAGLLHDIGKIGIRDTVLGKKEPLSAEEMEHLKEHVTIGYNILADLHPIRHLLPGVLYHHERWDGAGYPDGLAGEAIPLLARILAVADAYDAMSTTRPYRAAMPHGRVEEILQQGAGVQWDRCVVAAFLRCRNKIYAIRQRGVGESLRQALDGALRSGDSASEASCVRPPACRQLPPSHPFLSLPETGEMLC